MGILQGWLLLVSLPPAVSPLALDGSITDGTRWLLIASSLSIGLALIGFLRHKSFTSLARPAFLYAGIFLFLLGNSLVLLGSLTVGGTEASLFCDIFGSVTSGVGASVLFIGWAGVFFRFDERLMRVSVAATIMFAALFVLLIDLLPLPLGIIALFAAFLFTCASLLPFSKEGPLLIPQQESEAEAAAPPPADKNAAEKNAPLVVRPYTFLIGVAAMTLCFWAVFDYCKTIGQLVEATTLEWFVPTMALGALAALVLALVHLKLNRQLRFCPTIAIMAACLGLSIMLVEPFGVPAVPIAYALSFPLMLIALIELWILALRLAQRGVLPLALCIAGFLTPIYVGMVIGSFCAPFLAEGFPFVRIVLLFALLCPSLVLQSFLNEKERQFLRPATPLEPSRAAAEHSQPTDSHHLYDEVLAALSTRYGLSKREQEVLPYLARGRDIVYIGEELVVSKNTVISHTKHLYRKMGVRSKQELISLVEQAVNERMSQ